MAVWFAYRTAGCLVQLSILCHLYVTKQQASKLDKNTLIKDVSIIRRGVLMLLWLEINYENGGELCE